MRYELTDLRLFVEIALAKSLSAGASVLFITPSAASYRIKNLEQALGTPLFDRTSRGMELTPAGETVLVHAREVLEELERMQGDVGRFIYGIKGQVRLIANSSSLNGFITNALGRFLVAHPGIDVEMEDRQSETIPGAILAREGDIGIFAGPSEVDGLVLRHYAMDRLVIITPLGHPLAVAGPIKLAAALDYDFVCTARSNSNFLFLRDTAQRMGKKVRARLHAHNFESILTLVADGVGVALVPNSVLHSRDQAGRLQAVELEEPWAQRQLSLVVRREGRLPNFVEQLMNFLLDDPMVAATRESGPSIS